MFGAWGEAVANTNNKLLQLRALDWNTDGEKDTVYVLWRLFVVLQVRSRTIPRSLFITPCLLLEMAMPLLMLALRDGLVPSQECLKFGWLYQKLGFHFQTVRLGWTPDLAFHSQ